MRRTGSGWRRPWRRRRSRRGPFATLDSVPLLCCIGMALRKVGTRRRGTGVEKGHCELPHLRLARHAVASLDSSCPPPLLHLSGTWRRKGCHHTWGGRAHRGRREKSKSRLAKKPTCSASFSSQNSTFLLQHFSRNSVFQHE